VFVVVGRIIHPWFGSDDYEMTIFIQKFISKYVSLLSNIK